MAVMCMFSIPACAEEFEGKANSLYQLGLIKGTGESYSIESLEPYRPATRVEIAISLLRLLGKEEKALYQKNAHPFYDVPAWAGDSIGWLYENYYINGTSDTEFGAAEEATIQQFSAMCLRTLGYSEAQGDFTYGSAVQFAAEKGVLDEALQMENILYRADMIEMCYNTLCAPLKNAVRTLADKLCDEGVFTHEMGIAAGVLGNIDVADAFSSVPDGLCSITYSNGTIYLSPAVEHYGVRVFYMTEDRIVREATITKGEISYPGGSAAGYISEIKTQNIPAGASIIVVKTSSEGENYQTISKSNSIVH